MRVVIGLFNQSKLFSLTLVQSTLHAVSLLQSLERKNEKLRVMFVRERGEGDRREPPTLQPMNSGRVNSHSFFRRDVRAVLEIVVLSLLFGFEVESR